MSLNIVDAYKIVSSLCHRDAAGPEHILNMDHFGASVESGFIAINQSYGLYSFPQLLPTTLVTFFFCMSVGYCMSPLLHSHARTYCGTLPHPDLNMIQHPGHWIKLDVLSSFLEGTHSFTVFIIHLVHAPVWLDKSQVLQTQQ